jgi:hypothetical protein
VGCAAPTGKTLCVWAAHRPHPQGPTSESSPATLTLDMERAVPVTAKGVLQPPGWSRAGCADTHVPRYNTIQYNTIY